MQSFNRTPELTADGTYTLYIPEIDEHYHSTNGAMIEADHVYLKAGLEHRGLNKLSVLEIGFGTGLNAFMTMVKAIKEGLDIVYTTLELYPLEENKIRLLNYPELIAPEHAGLFIKMHAAKWNEAVEIVPGFTIYKRSCDLTVSDLDGNYDVVYYDAFAPDKQPEMWSDDIYRKVVESMNPNGVLTTYCAKGVVRRGFRDAGLTMERIPGPPGKREMIRGLKIMTQSL